MSLPPRTLPPRILLGDRRQYASVRQITLDDGAERGVRALAFSTGGGLDFWSLCDRSFDIGPLWWRGAQLGWQAPSGFRNPMLTDRWDDAGRGMERGFSGLLVTCGLEHIRRPDARHPLHGHLPFTPGRLLAHGEDWDAPEPVLYCIGEITQSRLGGEALRLTRRIEAPIGGDTLRIHDTLENLGPDPQSFALLYHLNLGYPLLAPGTTVTLDGAPLLGPLAVPDAGQPPPSHHAPTGPHPLCRVTAPGYPTALEVSYAADTLPCLQTWRNLRSSVAVLSLEPCTAAPDSPPPVLAPGERRRFSVALRLRPVGEGAVGEGAVGEGE